MKVPSQENCMQAYSCDILCYPYYENKIFSVQILCVLGTYMFMNLMTHTLKGLKALKYLSLPLSTKNSAPSMKTKVTTCVL